jgi:hypothetical protein
VEGLFDYVKVLRYNTCPPPCSGLSYQWKKNGNTVGTAQSLTATQPGTYIVRVTDCAGCTGHDTVIVSACSPADVNKCIVAKQGGKSPTIAGSAIVDPATGSANEKPASKNVGFPVLKIPPSASANAGSTGSEQPALAVTVQPNPGTDFFNLRFLGQDLSKPVTVRIFDARGMLVGTYQNIRMNATIRIAAGSWAAGIYFAEVRQGRAVCTIKLVKMN